MRCTQCLAENPTGMRYCGQCGAPLAILCPSCGTANPPANRFCGVCGAPSTGIAGGALPGEIKQVTVLFCDIVNSTALTERLGAEAMRDLVGAFIDTSIGEIRRWGGTAPQFAGDGFMALFGAPVAQEDHVRRALLAALAIRRALAGDGEADRDARLDLQIRIGIHTGPVVFGAIGGGFGIETAIGDTANTAARLQQAAEPGAILISATVRALAQGYARVEPVGPLTLKGKAEPVPAFRLVGVSRWRSARDAVMPARSTGFVGREPEHAVLRRLMDDVEGGRGQLVAVVGEPGIGKSRFLAEFRRRIEGRRIFWVEGRCLSHSAAIPYHLGLDVVRGTCGIDESDAAETIARKLRSGLVEAGLDVARDSPVLLHLLGVKENGGTPAPANPETVKARSFEVLHRFCIEGSRQRPLVLLLEDLHWIDAVSEEFLGRLAGHVAASRILLLATFRPEYSPPWPGLPNAATIALPSLSREDSLAVLRAVLPEERFAAPLAEEIVARADGNPLFLEQLALHAGEAEPRPDVAVPHTIHGVVMARIDRLPEAAKRLLQNAAVIGREFSLRLLRAVWEGPAPLDDILRELCRLDFIHPQVEPAEQAYVFSHALTQETAYRSLLERYRRNAHRAVGAALEALYPGRAEEVAELLALHFGRSEETGKAVDYAIAAAEKARRRWANADAETWFEDALRRLDAMPDAAANRLRRIDAVLKQAEVKYALGRSAEQLAALERVRSITEETGDPARQAAWHYWQGFLLVTAGDQPQTAIDHCRRAIDIASAASLEEIDAFAQSCLAQVYAVVGRSREAIAAGERAVSRFEAHGDLWWAGRTLWHLTGAANYLGDWRRSLDYCRRGLGHGIALDDLRLKTVGWTRLGLAHIQQGDSGAGLACCETALALGPIPRDAAFAGAVAGYGKSRSGRLDDGIAEMREALAWFERSHLRWTYVIGAVWLAEGHLRRGDRVASRPLIDHVLATSRTNGYRQFEGRADWLLAECLADEAPAAAEDHAVAAMQIFRDVDARNDLARAAMTRAALRQAAGDPAAARVLLDEAQAVFCDLGTLGEPQRVAAARAALEGGAPIPLLAGAA